METYLVGYEWILFREEALHMRQRIAQIANGLFLVVLVAGCTAPLFEITDNKIETGAEAPVTLEQVKAAIMDAGKGLNMKMVATKPGELQGTYQTGNATAVVAIPYTKQSYGIHYKSSQNLKYDGNKINKKYNTFVTNLDTAIRRELSKITKVTQTQKAEEPTTMGGLMNWVRSIGGSDDAKAKPAAEKPKDASTDSVK